VAALRQALPELRGVLPRADRAASAILRLEALQAELLRVQKRTLRIQLRSLATQRQQLKHVRSMDEKTGGDLTPRPR
jgi:chromosome segregation ATPase